jgi:hypothetical protein
MSRKLFLSLALFVFTLTACEFQEPVPTTPVPEKAEGGDCDQGTYRTFDMEYSKIGPGYYWVEVETGTFTVENCMCKLSSFKLYVSRAGARWELTVGSTGQAVPFVGSPSGIEDVLDITDLGTIYENIGNPGTGKVFVRNSMNDATVNRADGLCVVENYDGGGPGPGVSSPPIGSTATGPIIVFRTGPLPDSYIVEAFIPLGITNPI